MSDVCVSVADFLSTVHFTSPVLTSACVHGPRTVEKQPSQLQGSHRTTSSTTTPRGGPTSPPRRAQPLLLLSRSNPPLRGGGVKIVSRPQPRTRRCVGCRAEERSVAKPHPAARGDVRPHLPRGGRPPGRAGQRLLGKIRMSAGGSLSDRTAFKVYALQRLHAATFRGVAAMTSARPIWRTGPGISPGQAVLPWGLPRKGRRSAFHLTGASCPVFLLALST